MMYLERTNLMRAIVVASLAMLTTSTITASVARAQLPSVRLSSSTTVSGANVSLQLTLPSPAPAAGIPLRLSSSVPTAAVFQASNSDALNTTFPAGQTTLVVGVRTLGVGAPTAVVFTVTTSAGSLRTNLTVNPAGVAAVSVQPVSAPGGVPRTGTITLDGLAPVGSGAIVTLGATDASLVTVPSTVTVPPGARTATFPVLTQPVATTTSTSLTAGIGAGTAGKTVVSISPPVLRGLALSPSRVLGGSAMTGTVQLDAAAPSTGIAVTFTASPSTGLLVPRDLVIAPGATQAPFTVTTTVVSSRVDAVLTATSTNAATPSSATASLSVLSLDVASVTVSALHVYGGDGTDITVRLSGIATSDQVIPLRAVQTAGVAQSPPFTLPPSVTVPVGSDRVTTRMTTQLVSAPAEFQIVAGTAVAAAGNNIKVGIHARPTVQSITVSPSPVVASRTVGVTVQLAWPASPAFSSTPVLPLTPVVLTSSAPLIPAGPALPLQYLQAQATTTLPVGIVTTNSSVTLGARSGISERTSIVSVVPAPVTVGAVGAAPEPVQVSAIQLAASSLEGGSSTTGTLVLDRAADATGLAVALSSTLFAVRVPTVIQVPGGARQVSFTIATSAVAATQSATLSAAAPNSAAVTTTIRVVRLAVASVAPSVSAAYGGHHPVVVKISINEAAPTSGAVVQLASSLPGVTTTSGVPLPTSVTIPSGRSSVFISLSSPQVRAVSELVLRAEVSATSSALTASAVASPVVQVVPAPSGLEIRRTLQVTNDLLFTGTLNLVIAVTNNVNVSASLAAVLPPFHLIVDSDRLDILRPDTVLFIPGTVSYERNLQLTSPAVDANVTIRVESSLGERSRVTRTIAVGAPELLNVVVTSRNVSGGDPVEVFARLNRPAGPGGVRGIFRLQGVAHERTWAARSNELRTTIPTQPSANALGENNDLVVSTPSPTTGLTTSSRLISTGLLGTAVVDLRNDGTTTLLAGGSGRVVALLQNKAPLQNFRGVEFTSSDPALLINGLDRAVVMPSPGGSSVSQTVTAAALSAVPAVTRVVTVSAQSVHATRSGLQRTQLVVVPPPELRALAGSPSTVAGGGLLTLSVPVTPYKVVSEASMITIPIRIESSHPAIIPPTTATMRLDQSIARGTVTVARPMTATKVTLTATVDGKTVSTIIMVKP